MSETKIEIIVSGENASETLKQITAQLPDTAQIVPESVAVPTIGELIESGFYASGDLSVKVTNWFSSVETGNAPGPFAVLGICAAVFAVVYILERLIAKALLGRLVSASGVEPASDNRVGAALRWGFIQIIRLLFFYGVSRIGLSFLENSAGEITELTRVALSSLMLARIWYAVLEFLTGSDDPDRRPTSLTDVEANNIMRAALVLVVFLGLSALARDFVVAVVDAAESGALFAVTTRLLDAAAGSVFFLIVRRPVGRLIIRAFSSGEEPNTFFRLLSKYWPVLYILLLLLQVGAEARGYLSGTLGEDSAALKRSFAVFVFAPFLLAGLGLWRDRLLGRSDGTHPGRIQGIFSLLEGALVVGSGIFILYAWNIDPFATDLTGASRILPGLVSASIVIVIGISAWRSISAFLTVGLGADEDAEDGASDAEGGVGGSRIETVFPILRAFLSALIGSITVLLALTSLGVQIAPLLAGAGILGLAIGFGAQKIVEDIISGVLYLVEDAFRKGEYIETSEGKGVVESIMLRSVRLRHHNGPVFTMPFSAMGTIKNHSRDWVTVKLSFEVSPSEDLEKVRKLVKKVGAKLEEDPELEGQFLSPLKSQGAIAMVGSNYKIGVKFTTKPGEQFLIRRKALSAMQAAFRENDIHMAAPRVIVDSHENAAAAAANAVSGTPPA